jgi:hypothetical protein
MRKGFLTYEEMHKYFHHVGGCHYQSYMTLHQIPLKFLIYEENFILFFISLIGTPQTLRCPEMEVSELTGAESFPHRPGEDQREPETHWSRWKKEI